MPWALEAGASSTASSTGFEELAALVLAGTSESHSGNTVESSGLAMTRNPMKGVIYASSWSGFWMANARISVQSGAAMRGSTQLLLVIRRASRYYRLNVLSRRIQGVKSPGLSLKELISACVRTCRSPDHQIELRQASAGTNRFRKKLFRYESFSQQQSCEVTQALCITTIHIYPLFLL